MDISLLLGLLRLTVRVAVVVSESDSVMLMSAIATSGARSSSVMVAVAPELLRVTLLSLLKLRANASSISSIISPITSTSIALVVSPGAKIRVPAIAV